VFILGDLFGICRNSQLLADEFAAHGYLAVLPDLLDGDAISIAEFEAGKVDLRARMARHGTEIIDPVVNRVIEHVKADFKIKQIAGVGYCFGSKVWCCCPLHNQPADRVSTSSDSSRAASSTLATSLIHTP
jgi:dienelactone hydrolase